jgi:hypothetical protein
MVSKPEMAYIKNFESTSSGIMIGISNCCMLKSAIRTTLEVFKTTGLVIAFIEHGSIETRFITFKTTKAFRTLLLPVIVRINVDINVYKFMSDTSRLGGEAVYFVLFATK